MVPKPNPGNRYDLNSAAMRYHAQKPSGKLEVVPTKPCLTQHDLSLAYTPGVAEPCLAIQDDPEQAYNLTNKGNLVAVITNGSAVLGLGNIGALSGKPVMEGKAVLFKRFANIDVFDIELQADTIEEMVQAVKAIAPTFGGINLEDIKSPECFEVERRLVEELDIPVFHDDQHGTAIIVGAALSNALELVGKDMADIHIVTLGAGAAALSTGDLLEALGARRENMLYVDSQGVIYTGRREGMNAFKERIARPTSARNLRDALRDADVLIGLSGPGLVTEDDLHEMAPQPVIFAMANPIPEIAYELARAARPDAIVATGRSDLPNQVNNVLGFPFIFRGALDARARRVTMGMKLAASRALAKLAREDVPDAVIRAYGGTPLRFGPEYIIPKPFDPRVLAWVAPAVAQAAAADGVARRPIADLAAYRASLEELLDRSRAVMHTAMRKAANGRPPRIIFPEAYEPKILRACYQLLEQGLARPVLLGHEDIIAQTAAGIGLDLKGMELYNHRTDRRRERYALELHQRRQRKGLQLNSAHLLLDHRLEFGLAMLASGEADGLIAGLNRPYSEVLRPALQIIGLAPEVRRVCGIYMMVLKDRVLFFADATVNIDPDSETLAEIALATAAMARRLDIQPRVAMLSFSNFGEVHHPDAARVARAVEIIRERAPEVIVDGEMQADTATMREIAEATFPHSAIKGDANVLIFPDLASGNIAYKLIKRFAGAEAIGPILSGMARPVNMLNHYSTVDDIVNIAIITALTAEGRSAPTPAPAAARPSAALAAAAKR